MTSKMRRLWILILAGTLFLSCLYPAQAADGKHVPNPKELSIRIQPEDATVALGEKANFVCKAKGSKFTYQWEYQISKEEWKKVKGATAQTDTLEVKAKEEHDGRVYRCTVTDGAGNQLQSKTATLYIKPVIVTQPEDAAAESGQEITVSVKASGVGLTYQWEFNDTGKKEDWKPAKGESAETDTYTTAVKASMEGRRFRCRVTASNGLKAVSEKAVLTIIRMPRKVKLNETELKMTVGDSEKLEARIIPKITTYPKLTWTSTKETVATVNKNGRVYALHVGKTKIIVETVNHLKAVCAVQVFPKPRGVAISQTSLSLTIGESAALTAKVQPESVLDPTITWSSSNSNIVSVNGGTVTALAVGTAVITAKEPTGLKAECTVIVKPKPSVTFSVIGDSISTFHGYMSQSGAPSYYPRLDVTSVKQTWWWLFAQESGYTMLSNNSYSGRPVCHNGLGSGDDEYHNTSFTTACKNIRPANLILLFGATNDSWFAEVGEFKYSDWTEADLRTFRPALAYTLSYMKNTYTGSRIVFMVNTGLKSEIVSSIKTICAYYNVGVLMLSGIDKQYAPDNPPYLHPTAAGMVTIKNQLMAYLGLK